MTIRRDWISRDFKALGELSEIHDQK